MCSHCHHSPHAHRCPEADPAIPPRCPICASEADSFYMGRTGEIVGCEHCLISRAWWEL